MKENGLRSKSFAFALRIVKLYRYLQEQKQELLLSKELLRAGTSIGALVREAEHADSRADFTRILGIALKASHETDYWLELLYQSTYLDEKGYHSIHEDLLELLKLLTSIINTTKGNG